MGDRLGLLEEAEESRTVTVDITPMKIYGSAEEKLNSPDPHKWPRGNYFKDGKRVVDLVLAYQPNKPKKENDRTNHEICRQIFQRKMQHYGLELEFEGQLLPRGQDISL